MKRILVTNEEKLAAAIKEAEGKATARTVTVADIKKILDKVDVVPKKYMDGTTVRYDGAQQFPSAYRYRPESTHFSAENVKGKWYVTNIYRDTCPDRLVNTHVNYSDAAKEKILENASNKTIY